MTVTTDELILTDDEIVAVCVALDRQWPAGLATVEPDLDPMLEAAARGRRSLVVRGLLTSVPGGFGAVAGSIGSVVAAPLDGGLRWAVSVTDSALGGVDAGPGYGHLGAVSDDLWLTDVVHDGGVHRLSLAPRSACVEMLDGLLRAVFADGLDGSLGDAWLTVVGPADPVRVAQVGRGRVRRLLLADGDPTVLADAGYVDEALVWLGISL